MKLKHPEITGTQRIDAGGNQYYADESGVIEVPDALVDNLERVGWVVLDRPIIPMVQVEVAKHVEVVDKRAEEPAIEPADEEALMVEPAAAEVVEEPEA